MPRVLQYLVLSSWIVVAFGCSHSDPLTERAAQMGISPEQHKKMMHDSPVYRSLIENTNDYKTETRLFLQRVKAKTDPQQLQDWARTVLEEHKSDGAFFLSPSNVPSFVLNLDPPIEPTIRVVPPSDVTIFWGGGFGFWGLFVGDGKVPDNRVVYSIEWVPGIYAFNDLQ